MAAPRTPEEINQEYGTVCTQFGEIGFKQQCLQVAGNKLVARMHELGAEMEKAQLYHGQKQQLETVTKPEVIEAQNESPAQG